MAKERHEETTSSSNNAIIVLVIGLVVVGGLVAWALTRTVDVTPSTPPTQESAPIAVATAPITTETAARNTPPITFTAPPATTTAATTTAVTTTRPAEHDNTAEKAAVPRIAVEDLKAKWGRHDVTIIDVRDAGSYAAAHIPGAMHMQFASIEGMIDMIPKGKPIVLYCT
jgi:hypothetical protein